MLTDLNIRNFAIIDRLHVSFGPGFNVLTGETGAGKSIIIGALGLLLGERARAEMIRTGEEEASVEALFDLTGYTELRVALATAHIEEEGELLIRRIVARSGKNRIFLNGILATLGQIQPVAAQLLAIYGQHEHQSLLRAENHLAMLDEFAGSQAQLAAYAELYRELGALRQRLAHLEQGERERSQRIDLLSFQAREIAEASPREGEEEELEAERRLLLNAERLNAATEGGFAVLYGDEDSLCARTDKIAAELEGLSSIDPALGASGEALRSAQYILEDVAAQLRDYGSRVSFDPSRQDQVESRLAQLAGLRRKYGATIEEVLTYQREVDEELRELSDSGGTREGLVSRIAELEQRLIRDGESISACRRQAARALEQAVATELRDLAMEKARFSIVLERLPQPGPHGLEKAEFFIAPNPGEEPRPLLRIASGGELSRVMLALRRSAPGQDQIGTLIFDEVDAGVGGATATKVGEKLRQVAQGRQVLCITHLPQVAAFADRQFRIDKRQDALRTHTVVTSLAEDERVLEMARMLGGAKVTERALEHARELIAHSRVA